MRSQAAAAAAAPALALLRAATEPACCPHRRALDQQKRKAKQAQQQQAAQQVGAARRGQWHADQHAANPHATLRRLPHRHCTACSSLQRDSSCATSNPAPLQPPPAQLSSLRPHTPQHAEAVASSHRSIAAWIQELPDAPVFRPTPQQFEDPIAYIRSIQGAAAQYGARAACRRAAVRATTQRRRQLGGAAVQRWLRIVWRGSHNRLVAHNTRPAALALPRRPVGACRIVPPFMPTTPAVKVHCWGNGQAPARSTLPACYYCLLLAAVLHAPADARSCLPHAMHATAAPAAQVLAQGAGNAPGGKFTFSARAQPRGKLSWPSFDSGRFLQTAKCVWAWRRACRWCMPVARLVHCCLTNT